MEYRRREFLKKALYALPFLSGIPVEGRTLLKRHLTSRGVTTQKPHVVEVEHGGRKIVIVGVRHLGSYAKYVIPHIENAERIVAEYGIHNAILRAAPELSDRLTVFDPPGTVLRDVSDATVLLPLFLLPGALLNRRRLLKGFLLATVYKITSLAGTSFPNPLWRGREFQAYKKLMEELERVEKGRRVAVVTGAYHVEGIVRLLKDPTYRWLMERLYGKVV